MRSALSRFHLVVAILVAMLAAGSGLPGLVRVLSNADAHVCTCASGGAHASCPVCNPSLGEHTRSRGPAVDGVPCGEGRVGVAAPSQPATLPAPLLGTSSPGTLVPAPRAEWIALEEGISEPATPPPRIAST
jgi:hypothetical protein